MHVERKTVQPVPPPDTFDITGLTYTEAAALLVVVGRFRIGDTPFPELYNKLRDLLGEDTPNFTLMQYQGGRTTVVGTLFMSEE